MPASIRRRALLLAGPVALLLFPQPATALPILDPADAEELAAALAEATEEQDVCYGWDVEVIDHGSGPGGRDVGSSLGVGRGVTSVPNSCQRFVVFAAELTYTSESSESEDSAAFRVLSNIADAPTEEDLRRLGVTGGGLLGGSDDEVLANAVLALPALVAEAGIAPAIELEPNTAALPEGDGATGTPGSDWMRKYGSMLGALVLVILSGVVWAGWIVFTERPFRGRRRNLRSADGLPE